jgi:hypothetical protein
MWRYRTRSQMKEAYRDLAVARWSHTTGMVDLAGPRQTLAEVFTEPTLYFPSCSLLDRAQSEQREARGVPRSSVLIPSIVGAPQRCGIEPVFGQSDRYPHRSTHNLLLNVLTPLWRLRTPAGPRAPDGGGTVCDPRAGTAMPPRSATDCSSQFPPIGDPIPTTEPPQVMPTPHGDPGARCDPSCGATRLGGLMLHAKFANQRPPTPSCGEHLVDAPYTALGVPRQDGTGKTGPKSSPCPCECKCHVWCVYVPPWGPKDVLQCNGTPLVVPALLGATAGDGQAAFHGSSPAAEQLAQGELQGLGTGAGWEADVGLMRPALSRASTPPLEDGAATTFRVSDHPDFGVSLQIPIVHGIDTRDTMPRQYTH